MKKFVTGLVLLMIAGGIALCRKTSFISSPDALLSTSSDTLHFDTVFTSTGSVTQSFKVFNLNNQKLRLADVKLMGGNASAFKMNVDGSAGTSFSNIEIEPNDSLYVFVTVTVNPTAANLPFIVQDSILIQYNGNKRFVQLQAFGQNANFMRNRRVTKDSAWNNGKPFVILGRLMVDENVTLTINKGCKIYCHADAPILINGTLQVNGEKYDSTRVIFSGDRLDAGYRDYPGGWPGIYFNSTSKNNVLNYAIIKNAYQGITSLLPALNNIVKVTLNQSIIDNIHDAGITTLNSTVTATNCLISNCGNNITITAGGTYNFNHCTVVSYANAYIAHKTPVLLISNAGDQSQTFPLSAVFRNCILYGEGGSVDDEIAVEKKGSTAFSLSFENILYKNKNDLQPAPVNSIKNVQPGFDSTNAEKRYFNFRLKTGSAAINNAARPATVTIDLDGNPRGTNPDIGCYERQ